MQTTPAQAPTRIPLRSVKRASALAPLLLVPAYAIETHGCEGPVEAPVAAAMTRALEESIDAWAALGPVSRHRHTRALQRALDRLHRASLVLSAGAYMIERATLAGETRAVRAAAFVIAPVSNPRAHVDEPQRKTRWLLA